ncbi:hypothetical protein ALC57_04463 [Trachymyrmex cornetzi]|uniref:Uncharacterized protein n=1 Tax=Trachymyrmex cornetzi TaxID=471704 RepID=A0A151JC53_9HYME|nr:hypothetical protein ALC57_04463 [Trachymyrmex cornetzi]
MIMVYHRACHYTTLERSVDLSPYERLLVATRVLATRVPPTNVHETTESDSILMKISKNGLIDGSLQKNQISSFEESVYYLKVGGKLSLLTEHTLNELTLYCFV